MMIIIIIIYKHKELKPLVNTLKTCFNKENSYKVFIKLSWKFLVRIVKHLNKILKCFTFVQADRFHLIIKKLNYYTQQYFAPTNSGRPSGSVAYSSQGSHTGQLDSATDWQMAVQWDNVISITLRQVY